MTGARLKVGFIHANRRKKHEVKKCVVCGKMLMKHNNSGLCSNHSHEETELNRRIQLSKKNLIKINCIVVTKVQAIN